MSEWNSPDERAAPRLLIVDNNADRGSDRVMRLSAEGFRVESSDGGAGSVLWLAQTFRPWVIVIAHDPPRTDGVAACRALRDAGETAHVPVVLTLASRDEASTVEGLEVGANVVVAEPVSMPVLVAHVYAQLNVFQMVMELREKNQYLRELVVRDPMTGLYNHAHLHELLDREIARSRRTELPVSLLIVDLDRFKGVNDEHGHQAGDYCLKTTANLLTHGGRRSDAVARYGGDEFALILPDTPKQGAATRGEALRQRVEQHPYDQMNLPSQTISVGVATFPDDADDRAGLIGAADRALYASKRVGRNRVISYSRELGLVDDSGPVRTGAGVERLLALGDLIGQRQARFVYQPIVSVGEASIFAYEALCRPTHPAFKHAGEVFETGERAGRVAELGRALRQVATAPLKDLPERASLFLNLHPLELNEALVEEAREQLAPWSSRIVFEVTESSAITDYKRQRQLIVALQEQGFRVAVDDLGAGYAGLNSLALLKPDVVKLDMALVRGIQEDGSVSRLIRHILDFTREEGMLVVAEGVETEQETDICVDLGCDLLQGYFFAKPTEPFIALTDIATKLKRDEA